MGIETAGGGQPLLLERAICVRLCGAQRIFRGDVNANEAAAHLALEGWVFEKREGARRWICPQCAAAENP